MKTIICKFKSDGTYIRKTAIINDKLDYLSKSKENEATDILNPYELDYEGWSICFDITDTLSYEVVFEFDKENSIKTLKPIKAITWIESAIMDVQEVQVLVR